MTATARQEATRCSRRAGVFTRRAERDARQAEEFYQEAAKQWRHARWLTRRPSLWDAELRYTPADIEANARCWERLGHTYLRSSFHDTWMAESYKATAAGYRATAARLAAV